MYRSTDGFAMFIVHTILTRFTVNSTIYTIFLPDLHVKIGSCPDKVMWTGVDQAWDILRTKTHSLSNINLTKFLTPFLGDLWFKDFSNEWLKWWNWTWKSSRSLSIQMIHSQIVLYCPQSRRIYFEKSFHAASLAWF